MGIEQSWKVRKQKCIKYRLNAQNGQSRQSRLGGQNEHIGQSWKVRKMDKIVSEIDNKQTKF